MGTYLHFSLKDASKVDEANKILDVFWSDEDVRIEKEKGPNGIPDYLDIGQSIFKLSGTPEEDIEKFTRGMERLREAGIEINWSDTSDVSDYLDDEMGKRMMGEREWNSNKKRVEKWNKDYQVSKEIYEKSRRFKKEDSPGVFIATDRDGRRVHLVYGNCDYPTFLKVVPVEKPPIELDVYEEVGGGDRIVLMPLQRLGTDEPFGKKGEQYDFYQLHSRLTRLGVRINFARMLYDLYNMSIPFDWIKLMATYDLRFLALEDIRDDLRSLGKFYQNNHLPEIQEVKRVLKRRKPINVPDKPRIMYLQFLLAAGSLLGMKKEDASKYIIEGGVGAC